MLMLEYLDLLGVREMKKVLNLYIITLTIPEIWKMGRVLSKLKECGPGRIVHAYLPILSDTLEALLLPFLIGKLAATERHHGVRKRHNSFN